MAKKSTPPPASARQAKIQAAQKSQGSGANKIVVAAVVAVVAIIVVVVGVIWMEQSKTNDVTGGGNALPTGVSALGAGYPAFQDVTRGRERPDGRHLRGLPVPGLRELRGRPRRAPSPGWRRRARSSSSTT